MAHFKAQNEILVSNMTFLRNFLIFQHLSESALSALTYHMKEMNCYRGQKIYREDIDLANKIYLIKQGQFVSFKKLLVANDEKKLISKDIGSFLKNEIKYDNEESIKFDANSHVSKFKLMQTNQKNKVE